MSGARGEGNIFLTGLELTVVDSLLREKSANMNANQTMRVNRTTDWRPADTIWLFLTILFGDRTTIYLLRKRERERKRKREGKAPNFGHQILPFFGWPRESRSFCARQVKLRLTQHSVAVIVRKRAWSVPSFSNQVKAMLKAEIYPCYVDVLVVVVVDVVSSSVCILGSRKAREARSDVSPGGGSNGGAPLT